MALSTADIETAQLDALRLLGCERFLGSLADQSALLLRHGRVDVEHEGIDVGTELGHDEPHAFAARPFAPTGTN